MKPIAKPTAQAPTIDKSEGFEMSPLLTLQNLVNQDFERFFSQFGITAPSTGTRAFADFRPNVNVSEKDGTVHVEAELPGVDINDVTVSVEDNVLTISGERRQDTEKREQQVYRREISYGAFRRSIALPGEGDANRARAAFKKGILTIELPITARKAAAMRQIPISNT